MPLREPEVGDALIDADRALAEAVRRRLAQGGAGLDAQAIALRPTLKELDPVTRAALQAVAGRILAAGRPVVVAGHAAPLLAADRFGGARAVHATAEAALAALGEGLALLDIDGLGPWWARLLARPDLAVVGALPDTGRGRPGALLVARGGTGPTGDDRTFWVSDSAASDARIAEAFARVGLIAAPAARDGGLKLFMLTGYVQVDDPRLDDPAVAALGRLSGVIGHAPVL